MPRPISYAVFCLKKKSTQADQPHRPTDQPELPHSSSDLLHHVVPLFFFQSYDADRDLHSFPTRRSSDLAIDSTVDIFTFYVPHRHVYGEQWIKFMKDGVNATPLPTVNTTGYIDHAAFLGTINPDTNKIPKHLFQGYLNIYN